MKRKLAAIIALIVISFVAYIGLAGTYINVLNQSGENLKNIQIAYGKHSLSISNLANGADYSEALSKVGEGATFHLSWESTNGDKHTASFNVYFSGDSGYEKLEFRLLPTGESDLIYQGRKQSPDKVPTRN